MYTSLAVVRSETGCSTVLIPWVQEPVMVTPEVVGLVGISGLSASTRCQYHALPPAPWYQHVGHARSPFSAGGGVSASSRAAIAALPRSIVARMSGLRWNAALS